MLSKFFLDRPVFAWVIAIIIMLAGGLAIHTLPISQYPPIAPPSIAVDAYYPRASAETVENSVVQIIEWWVPRAATSWDCSKAALLRGVMLPRSPCRFSMPGCGPL